MRLIHLTVATLAGLIAMRGQEAHAGPVADIVSSIGMILQDTGHVAEKPQGPLAGAIQDAEAVYRDLVNSNSLVGLISLSVMTNPCLSLDCHGLPPAAASRLVNNALLQQQAHSDALLRQQQAWATISSSGIALCSLVISVGSFVRAGRTSRKTTEQVIPEAVPAPAMVRKS